jgi:hypothetical protein
VNASGQPTPPGGSATIDGISWSNLSSGARVLLLNQGGSPGALAASNGVWIFQSQSVAMQRSPDFGHGALLDNEIVIRVSQGNCLANTEWVCPTTGLVTVDMSPLAFQDAINGCSSPLGSLNLSPGTNPNVAVVGVTNVIALPAPGGAFSISGLAGGWDGREVILINPTPFPMTIKHQDPTAAAGNSITCSTGADLNLSPPTGGFSWCRLKYCTRFPGVPSGGWLAMESSPAGPVLPPQPAPWQFLPNVVLSLRSDTGVTVSATGNVTGWADQSGAVNSVVGAGASGGPAYSPTGGPSGFPTLSGFSSTAYLNNTTQNLVTSGAPRTVLFVGEATSVGGAYFTFRLGTSGGTQTMSSFNCLNSLYCWTDGVDANRNETFPPSSFITGVPVIIVAGYQAGSLLALRVNGATVTTAASGGPLSPTTGLSAETGPTGFSVGVREDLGSPAWDGSILEVHVCQGQLTVAQCEQFEAYASTRYGIAI